MRRKVHATARDTYGHVSISSPRSCAQATILDNGPRYSPVLFSLKRLAAMRQADEKASQPGSRRRIVNSGRIFWTQDGASSPQTGRREPGRRIVSSKIPSPIQTARFGLRQAVVNSGAASSPQKSRHRSRRRVLDSDAASSTQTGRRQLRRRVVSPKKASATWTRRRLPKNPVADPGGAFWTQAGRRQLRRRIGNPAKTSRSQGQVANASVSWSGANGWFRLL